MFRIICSLILFAMLVISASAQESFLIGHTWYTMVDSQPVPDLLYPVKYTIMSENDSTAWVKIYSTAQYKLGRHNEIATALTKIINERTKPTSTGLDYLVHFPQHGRYSYAPEYTTYMIDSLVTSHSVGGCNQPGLDSAQILYHFYQQRWPSYQPRATKIEIIELDSYSSIFTKADIITKADTIRSNNHIAEVIFRQNVGNEYYLLFYRNRY